ncbi:MAG: biotin/lipoyl-binding protein [Oscillospiraceae bacterium]|nr:biotin/lipoyl-binding protein [Oscillospiraceae bacterium]
MKRYSVTVNGSVYDVVVEEEDALPVSAEQKPAAAEAAAAANAAPARRGDIKIESPMPGTIIDVKVKAGDEVQKNTVIALLEAMKMENDIVAATDGRIAGVNVKKGDSVNTGTIIATMTGV